MKIFDKGTVTWGKTVIEIPLENSTPAQSLLLSVARKFDVNGENLQRAIEYQQRGLTLMLEKMEGGYNVSRNDAYDQGDVLRYATEREALTEQINQIVWLVNHPESK